MDAFSWNAVLTLALLANADFNVRERVFIPLPVAAIGALHSDAEVVCRCNRKIESDRVERIKEMLAANYPLPWIDALHPDVLDRCEIINSYLTAAREFFYEDQADWPHWRRATELYLYSLSYEQAKETLANMPRESWWAPDGDGWKIVTPPPKSVPVPSP